MTVDDSHRRDTRLGQKLKSRIAASGPISVCDYMRACLQDEDDGYYRVQQAIGAKGDFITAPEVSQVFGEIIGMWCAVVWQQMGSPRRLNLIELGPGRGTLMKDLLRAAQVVPAFSDALAVHLVESSAALTKTQRATLADGRQEITWHQAINNLRDMPTAASIVIGNEFLDAIPVDQLVKVAEGWRQRGVGLDEAGELCFTELGLCAGELSCSALDDCTRNTAIKETQSFTDLALPLAEIAAEVPLAALFLDYGYSQAQTGETLQAIRAHEHEHVLTSPGEADISAYVDFSAFAFQTCGLAKVRGVSLDCDGPVDQSVFLGSLGIAERSARLIAQNPSKAGEIELATARLMAPQGMGTRFKAVGLRTKSLPPLPGFHDASML